MKPEEEKIELNAEEISKVILADEPMGEKRQDRGVRVKDASGKEMKTSSIMMGYNKAGVVLENGEYVSAEEVQQALVKAISEKAENKRIICKKTGKVVSATEMTHIIIEAAKAEGLVTLGGKSDRINNQNTATISVTGKGEKGSVTKGILMLGNQGLAMPSGDYIKLEDIVIALEAYMKPLPPIPPIPPTPTIPTIPTPPTPPTPEPSKTIPIKKEIHKVKKIDKIKFYFLPPLLAALIVLFGGTIIPPGTVVLPDELIKKMTLDYEANEEIEKKVIETIEEFIKRAYGGLNIGDYIHVYPGLKFHESSDWKYGGANDFGIFGSQLRPEGNYVIEYISIIYKGVIYKVAINKGDNLYDVLKATADKYGVSITDLEAEIHLTGPVSGWVDVNELLKDVIGRKITSEKIRSEKTYSGSIENYNGGTITFETPDGPVTINIKDKYGNFLDDGTVVTGSDGKQYAIKLELKEVETLVEGATVRTGWDINWNIENAPLLTLSAIAAAAFISALTARRRSKEFLDDQKEPIRDHTGSLLVEGNDQNVVNKNTEVHLEGFGVAVTGQDIIEESESVEILLALEEAKKNYDKKSGFTKFINKMRNRVPKWNEILQDLNSGKIKPETVAEMFKK